MKKIYNKVSLFSRILNRIIKSTSLKRNFLTEENTKKLIKKLSNKKYCTPEKLGLKLENNYNENVYSYNGTLSNPKKKIILYIHGGSYIEEASSYQIKFAMKIAKKSDATMVMPVYPLAPQYTYKDTLNLINALYNKILKTKSELYFLGDSAGGGFSLGYSMYLRDKNKEQPKKILLLSPWLDLTLQNPIAKTKEKKDTTCAVNGNRYAGKLWAGELDLKDYLLSPIYGKFDKLPEITIATGEFDTMQPDCLKLSNTLSEQQINHNYIEYKGQSHDFGVYPIKEARMLIDDFANIISEDE